MTDLASYIDVEVSGALMQALVEALGDDVYPVLSEMGIAYIDADRWYPESLFLEALAYVEDNWGAMDLVGVGMKIVDTAYFPERIRSLEDALESVDKIYQLNHMNHGSAGWEIVKTGRREYACISNTPYPTDLEYGILYALAQNFRPNRRTTFSVEIDQGRAIRENGSSTTTYTVSWG